MGMTIDECLEKLAHEKQCFIDEGYQNDGELEAYDMAIETMRKYQKITNIVMNGDDTHYKLLMQIREVIEDGNVDN